jgi:3-mercaptopyruvate sulfurtransferase SseA
MERLIEYVSHHPYLAGIAVLALVLVVAYESRARATAFSSIGSQDLIRLMNQGALVLDIRKAEEFAQGHVHGAKHLPSDQILTAGDTFRRFKEKPVVI